MKISKLKVVDGRLPTERAKLRKEDLRLLVDSASALLLADDPEEAVKNLTARIAPSLGIDVCFHYMVVEGERRLRLAFFQGVPAEMAEAMESLESDHPLCRRIVANEKPVTLEDLSDGPETSLVRSLDLSAYVCFPLVAFGGLLGTLGFGGRSRLPFSRDEIELLQAVSFQLASALERLRMIRMLQERNKELARSQRELQDFLENGSVGLHWVGPDGTILWANQAELDLLGYAREEYVGRNIAEFHADRRAIEDIMSKLSCGSSLKDYEARMRCKDGSVKDVLIDSNVLWEDGRFTHTRCFTRDITQRKRAEEALRTLNEQLETKVRDRTRELLSSNEELEAFCYSVAHDLRSPLRGINGFSRILEKRCAEKLDGEEKGYFHRIRASSERMAQLIDGLLELAKLVRVEMHSVDVDLSRLAEETLQELGKGDPSRRVSAFVQHGLTVRGDERLLRALLANLLENAWKFTGKHAEARIELGERNEGGERAFFVRDDGAGFDMAYVDKLFQPFERLHAGEFPGTGIGLATVQRIVKRHWGKVWACGAIDKGATFYFTLSGKR